MKALFLSIGVVSLLTLASCSKEKTCECTESIQGIDNGVVSVSSGSKYTFTTKAECSSGNSQKVLIGATTTTTCVEK